jgi:hypothetical protein
MVPGVQFTMATHWWQLTIPSRALTTTSLLSARPEFQAQMFASNSDGPSRKDVQCHPIFNICQQLTLQGTLCLCSVHASQSAAGLLSKHEKVQVVESEAVAPGAGVADL